MDLALSSGGGEASAGEDRTFIEISELDRLLGLPPPRFDPHGLEADPEVEFTLPQKPGLPRRMDIGRPGGSETEVCYDKELSKVSVIKSELNIGSDGCEEETPCERYLMEPVPVPPAPAPATVCGQGIVGTAGQTLLKRDIRLSPQESWNAGTYLAKAGLSRRNRDVFECVVVVYEMLYKRSKARGKTGVLNRVVSKLLAKGEPSDDSILQTLLLDPAPVPVPAPTPTPASVCDKPIPKTPAPAIPSPVISRLKKLGTSVEVELPSLNGQVDAAAGAAAYRQIMESLDKAVGLTSDLTKKKKRKSGSNQVPSNLKLLAEIDNSDNMTKFSFQVDAKQVIELSDGQKLYTCDICSGVYHRGFSLKRHYLKTHINYKHISKRDLHNCGILFDPSIEKGGGRKKQLIKEDSPPVVSNLSPPCDIPDLYRCHTCGKCFMLIHDLKTHLMEHPPVSVQNLNEDQFKNYTCPNCKARYQKKKLFLRHKEMCGKEIIEPEPEDTAIHYCLYCEKSFPTFILKKKHHLQMHHPKKKLHQCYLCKTKMFKERLGVFKHLLLHHPDEYIGCLSCKLRFGTRDEYKKHNKENHKPLGVAKKLLIQQNLTAKSQSEEDGIEARLSPVETEKLENNGNPNLVLKCTECPKMFACYLNMTRHRRIAHRLKKKKKVLKKDINGDKLSDYGKTPTSPPVMSSSSPHQSAPPSDPEVLFYSTIAHNIRENLTHHLDGKLDSQEVMEYDLNKATATEARNKLNFSAGASFSSPAPASQPEATSTPAQQKEPRATPISPRAPREKFNFPKNYDGRCGLTSYIKDMSHLDISTQLTMRRNLQRLHSTAGQETNKESPSNIPAGLLLVERPGPDCAEAFGEPEPSKDKGGSELVLSGEWVRPRTYLCSACGYKSSCLWEMEDHKYSQHPNVWVPHVEIVGEQSSAWDWFYHRRLPPQTEVERTTPAPPALPLPCSKCGRHCPALSDLHRHMLECGGDTSWQSLVGAAGGRRRKWRPFGSRRRKHQGRHGLKRNIPNTPAKHSCGRIRTKPGDMDTIQKMIANLPAKRTRRAIGEDLEIKTRSQATINSNRLLRKRHNRHYKVPISSLATHSSAARHSAIKASKVGKGSTKLHIQKKVKTENTAQEEKIRKEVVKVKEEPVDNIFIKEENIEKDFHHLEAENTVQHSDILTSLQMIRVVRTSTEEMEPEKEKVSDEEPIETSKILAAMREAMLESGDKIENRIASKSSEKRKKSKAEDKYIKTEPACEVKKSGKDPELIICNGCGMQFDNASACQRHKKKCVYWKEDKASEDNGTNRCAGCGGEFPYLMALLRHDCGAAGEEPVMPQLCPERPVGEAEGDSVEDIPILSPVDESLRRLTLVGATVSRVSGEAFDVTPYHNKYFNTASKKKQSLLKVNKSPEVNNQHSQKKVLSVPELLDGNVLETPKPSSSVKSPSSKDDQRNKKVSEIFKEIKRQGGRKRHKIKVKMANKMLASKVGLRKPGMKISSSLMKKRMDRKKRTSNFVMLMKEYEKLQKEGAVAVGKRKRIGSNSESSFRPVRSRRRIVSTISKADYADIDSVISDLSDIQDMQAFLESSSKRSSRRTNSTGSFNDFLESSQETTENCLLIPPENIKKELMTEEYNGGIDVTKDMTVYNLSKKIKEESSTVVQKRRPGRPPRQKILPDINTRETDSVDPSVSSENCSNKRNSVDRSDTPVDRQLKVEKEESSPQNVSQPQDAVVSKRKPGRPRYKSITEETEQHIREAIDNIIKRTVECNISENSNNCFSKENSIFERKIFEEDKIYLTSPEITKPASSASQNIFSKQETDEHIQEAIESVLNQTQDVIAICREVDWPKIEKIIYNVSIGSAEVFKESENDVPCSTATNSDQASVKKRKRRKRKKIFTKFLKRSQKPVIKRISEAKSSKCIDTLKNELINVQTNQNSSEVKITQIVPSVTSKVSSKSEGLPTSDLRNKLVKNSKEESHSTNIKLKEVKTKQLSIEDYLTISHYVKGSIINATKDKNNDHENKKEEGYKISNNLKGTDKGVNVPSVSTPKEEVSKSNSIEFPSAHESSRRVPKQSPPRKQVKQHKPDDEVVTDIKPLSPCSTSSREDITLSAIKDKVIKKKKKKLKLKKLLKNKHIDIMDSKISKITKPKIAFREDRHFFNDKLLKKRKKIQVGVSRNRWEVSVVENKNNSVELLCKDESKTNQPTQSTSSKAIKKFYCSVCDVKFESSYNLYEHQLTAEHNLKSTVAAVNRSNLSEENDPVKYCKSIGNIINDLEKRTLNVAKVMHQLKQKEGGEAGAGGSEAGAVVESTSSPTKDEWGLGGEWWEGAPLDVDTSCTSSLGTLMVDTVNKLLSSDQDLLSEPPYSLADLQLAMGASDEEMAMLFQLGEHSLQEEYVYDSSRPAEEGPTLMDLDHQSPPAPAPATPPATRPTVTPSPSPSDTLLEVRKQEPLSDSEDSKAGSCRGGVGKLLGDYESREMVCPTCNKHFLGLPALQTHVAWSHCAPVPNATRLKRRALLSSDDVDHRLVCFVCKEIVPTAAQLEAHIQAQHTKKADDAHDTPKPVLSEAAEKLRSKMSLALGGLVDRALNKLLGTGRAPGDTQPSQADLNSGALQLLGRLCAARKRVGNENLNQSGSRLLDSHPPVNPRPPPRPCSPILLLHHNIQFSGLSAETLQLLGRLRAVSHKDEAVARPYSNLAEEMRAILARGRPVGVSKGALAASVHSNGGGGGGCGGGTAELKPTNLLDHLAVCSSDVQERPYACPICDLRFLIPSTRNRHIARAHGQYGRRYDEEVEEIPPSEDHDHDWKSSMDTDMDANDDGEMLPLCSDCGLSFQSIHEVMQHRIEDHPRRFSADAFQEDEKPKIANKISVVESSSEIKETSQTPKNDVKLLPVSDNAIDSTSTMKKKRGRPAKLPEFKASLKRKCPEKKCSPNRKSSRKKKQPNDNEDEQEDSEYNSEEEPLYESSREMISNVESNSADKHTSRASSEENLAELSRKLDRRKVRMGNMAEEAVRVKAEAALRELNLAKKQKSPSSAAKWGINAVKFTKNSSTGISSSQLNGSPTKPRFASLGEKKWKIPTGLEPTPKPEPIDVKPDIYDFRDEELETNKKPFPPPKESHSPESEHWDSNKSNQSNTWNVTGSPRKTSRLNADNS